MEIVICVLFFFWVIHIICKGSDKPSNKYNQSIRKLKNGNIDIGSTSFDKKYEDRKKTWKELYLEDLEDVRWYKKRDEILRREDFKCQWCGSTHNLQVHHKYYNKYPDGSRVRAWDYPDDCLMVLCNRCHKKYHSKYQVKSYYRKKGLHYE